VGQHEFPTKLSTDFANAMDMTRAFQLGRVERGESRSIEDHGCRWTHQLYELKGFVAPTDGSNRNENGNNLEGRSMRRAWFDRWCDAAFSPTPACAPDRWLPRNFIAWCHVASTWGPHDPHPGPLRSTHFILADGFGSALSASWNLGQLRVGGFDFAE
jgi:hypothetical protein